MDIEQSFARMNGYIKDGRTGLVRPEADSVADSYRNDPAVLIKCASLLKVIDDEAGAQRILDMAAECLPGDEDGRFSIAAAFRGLGRTDDALDILLNLPEDEKVLRETARALLSAGDSGSALDVIKKMNVSGTDDTILLTEALCASGKLGEAYDTARKLAEIDKAYDALVNLCMVLIRMGRVKDAVKTARAKLKEDKKSADSLALGAYVMRITGKTAAAAGLAHSALKIDHTHIGALETMGLSLAEKRKFTEAKLMAGAINDRKPGHPAAIRILDACRIANE